MDGDAEAIRALIEERDQLKQHCERLQALTANLAYPAGHFYSPVVDTSDPHAAAAVASRAASPLPAGIHIDLERMKAVMRELSDQQRRFPFPRQKQPEYHYYFDNPFFGCHDASIWFSMLLHYKPRRVIEVGCGYSTCLLLDVNDRFFAGNLELTLIDPALDSHSDLFGELRGANVHRMSSPLQDVSLALFETLEANDVLFIDSSHVCKTGSDVNYYFFEILPKLKPGVLVHVHDVLYPFEYPQDWVLREKRSWNEAYLLRAFLQYNSAFEILYWANLAYHRLGDLLAQTMPLCLENEGGSIWMRRLDPRA